MRLTDVLSKESSKNFEQVENFFIGRVKTGINKKLKQGKIGINFFCENCNSEITFCSDENIEYKVINKNFISINSILKCSRCDEVVLIWFLVEIENSIDHTSPKVRIRKSVKHLSDKVMYNNSNKYEDKELIKYLDKARFAYDIELGAGANIYLRKIFEQIIVEIAKKKEINLRTNKNKRRPIKKLTEEVNEKCNIIPKEFIKDDYKLYEELSEIIHSNYDENKALEKYEYFNKLIIAILNEVKKNDELLEIIKNLGWN